MHAFHDGVVKKVGGFSFNQESYRQFAGARWVDERDLIKYEKEIRGREARHPGWLVALARRYELLIRSFRTFAEGYSNTQWSRSSNEQLLLVFKKFSTILYKTIAYVYIYIYLNRFFSDEFSVAIAKQLPDINQQNETYRILFALKRLSETRQEKMALLSLATAVAAGRLSMRGRVVEKKLRDLERRFAHLNRYVMYGHSYTLADYRRRVAQLARHQPQQEAEAMRKEIVLGRQAEILLKKLSLPKGMSWKIRGARAWITAAQEWDESFIYLMHHLQPYWDEVAGRLGVSYSELIELTSDEFKEHLQKNKKLPASLRLIARQRYQDSSTIFADGRIRTLWGQALKEYTRREAKAVERYRHIRILKGMPVSPGHVRGRVAVTYSITEIGKVKKGDILVAAGTTPAHVPAMERAAAIVTDEGGLLCHAAIVARELKIPCVVGTKIATKVFKDGDKVEVDADHGIIKRC